MKTFNPTHVNHIERMNAVEPSWLIAECIAGNEAAIELFVQQHQTGIFKLALSIVGDQAEANEVTQETFIAALRSLGAYQDRKSLRAWLYTIALNKSRSQLRKRKILERLRETVSVIFRVEAQKQSLPEDTVIESEEEAALWRELNKLDERHRIVIVLRYFQDLSIAEIAEILSMNEGTIHSRLHTARARLRIALEKLHGE